MPLCSLLVPHGFHPAEDLGGQPQDHSRGAAPIGSAAGHKAGGGSEEQDYGRLIQDGRAGRKDLLKMWPYLKLDFDLHVVSLKKLL